MPRLPLKQFASQNGFNMVSKVRVNASGYKFITFLSSDDPNHTENIYFGVRFAEEGGYKEGDNLKADDLFITDTINAAGETRLKITDKEGDAVATLVANGYQTL
jgi:hypothetical protein